MAVRKGETLQLSISTVAFGGRGLAKPDGFAVFVDGAVPGDVVSARITRKKKNHGEARILEILESSPHRVTAPCPYSGFCGGCKWQFLKYEKQLQYKQQHVVEALAHIGGIHGVPVHPAIPSERIFHYRNKMEFSCSDRRWLLPHELEREDIDRGFALGLHVPGTFYKVLDTRTCLLQPARGDVILEEVREYIKASGLPVYGLKSHEGFWRFVMLRHSVASDQWLVNIVTASENRTAVQPLADMLVEKYPDVVSVVNNITSRKAGVAIGEIEVPLAGARCLTDRIHDLRFEISANSFFQTNTRGAGILYDTVAAYAGLTGVENVVDLYSGTGTIAICLSRVAGSVLGMEIIESAVGDAERNCRRNRIENCRFLLGDIRDNLGRLETVPEVMIIDPPRVGMHKDVVKGVTALAPSRIVYVSCNPATLARDLAMLKDTYRVLEVQPVDMFPHTYHIEAVARLEHL